MRAALARIRPLILGLVVLATAGRADAQLLEIPPFIALDHTFQDEIGSYSVAVGADDSILVMMNRWGQDSQKREAWVQRFSPTGSPLGGMIRLDETTDTSLPRIEPDARGGFIAHWHRRIGAPLIARFLAPTGEPTSPPFTVSSQSVFLSEAAGLPSGSVFVWNNDSVHLRARRYDVAGQPAGAVLDVATLPAHAVFAMDVADRGDGGFVVAWNEDGRILGRLFDASGTPLDGETELVADLALSVVATNPLGGFVVVGTRQEDTHARPSGVWARRFATDGTPSGPSFVVDPVTPGVLTWPKAAFDPHGRLYVAWGVNSFSQDPHGRAYDQAGRPLHAAFRVFEDSTGIVHLAARPDGRFVEGRLQNRDFEMQVRNLCVPPHHTGCGDGVVSAPCERCDDGPANSDSTPNACRTTCALPTCGDGVIDFNEDCDDGNLLGCDGCDSECNVEVGFVCGDGVVFADCNEECDDGPANDDTLPDACRTDCRRAHCGDAVIDTGEPCDDGNVTSCDGCSDICVPEPGLVCGDGIPELLCGEQCDDANAIAGDGCTTPCALERVPGGGSPKSDCLTEWVVDNASNVPRYDKKGAISGTQVCVDGDTACDFDGGVAGSCTFHVRVCANNTDIEACEVSARLQSWQLRAPSEAKAATRPALAAVRAAFTSVPGAVVGPPLPDVCSGVLAVPIAVRTNASGTKPGSLALKSYATDYIGRRDSDKIKLICMP